MPRNSLSERRTASSRGTPPCEFFPQVRHDFRVGFRDELVAFFLQFFFQFEVVFDDAL